MLALVCGFTQTSYFSSVQCSICFKLSDSLLVIIHELSICLKLSDSHLVIHEFSICLKLSEDSERLLVIHAKLSCVAMSKGYKHAQQLTQVHHPPNFAVIAERALHFTAYHCKILLVAMLYALLLFTAFQKDNIGRSGCAFEVHAKNFAPG